MNTTATADTIDLGKDAYSETQGQHHHKRGRSGRRKWAGIEIATVIGGFVLFWPAGLLALGVKLVKGEIWPGSRDNVMPWTAARSWYDSKGDGTMHFGTSSWSKRSWQHSGSSGNAAFDAYKKEQLDRLEAERRKLDEEQKAFAEHLTKLREAKDKDEFDRFMAERAAKTA
jgi:hypothetical protein